MPLPRRHVEEPLIPERWSDDQLRDLIGWLTGRVAILAKASRTMRKAHRDTGANFALANADYYRNARSATKWLQYHLECELTRRRNKRSKQDNGTP